MKFSANFIVALLASLAAFAVPSTNALDLILRAMDATDDLFSACATDADFIGTELIKIYNGAEETSGGGGGRALRTRALQTAYCKNVCKGFMPGMCVYVYPQCKGMRRNLDQDESLVNEPVLQEENTLACASLYVAMHDEVVKLAGQVEEACAAELLAPQEYKCFRIIQN